MAGRPSRTRRLDVWMNGQLVGQWRIAANGVQQFAYDATWHDSQAARPLSLSLPLSIGTKAVAGPAVAGYFDNLLPDSTAIRNRIASRHGAASGEAFDLRCAVRERMIAFLAEHHPQALLRLRAQVERHAEAAGASPAQLPAADIPSSPRAEDVDDLPATP